MYVDDMLITSNNLQLITGNNLQLIESTKQKLHQTFKGLGGAKPMKTPFEYNQKLIVKELDDITCTLSKFVQQPKSSHWEAALRIVRYVKKEPDMGVMMSSEKSNTLSAY
ncbi:uncharacterized protein [Nicotiana tomentosiformis]|uniref:uncharacterized protein n=1 Tax=Nicotiana tomentosiformis TaxID=4098 RepID=UPI00388C616B